MTDLEKRTYAVMNVLSELSLDAKDAGDGDLMHAANRAFAQLYNHQTVKIKDQIVAKSLPNGQQE